MAAKRLYILILGALLLLSAFESCKKGCTDTHAFNYTHSAKTEDGSCVYCDSSEAVFQTLSTTFSDFNMQSQYYDQPVLTMNVIMKQEAFTGNACASHGLGLPDQCTKFFVYPTLVNLTGSTMTVSGQLFVSDFSSSQYYFENLSITIPPNSSANLGKVGQICIFQNSGSFTSFTLNSTNPFFSFQ